MSRTAHTASSAASVVKRDDTPQLHLVKDDGIYLLSNAAHGPNELPRLVVYAHGYRPPGPSAPVEEALAFHDQVCAAVGGDDFVEGLHIPVNAQTLDVLRKPGTTYCVDVDATSLTSSFETSA